MLELISSRLREVLELTLFKHIIAAIGRPCAFALYYNCIRFHVVLFIYVYFYTSKLPEMSVCEIMHSMFFYFPAYVCLHLRAHTHSPSLSPTVGAR